jgi:hypothetical protein
MAQSLTHLLCFKRVVSGGEPPLQDFAGLHHEVVVAATLLSHSWLETARTLTHQALADLLGGDDPATEPHKARHIISVQTYDGSGISFQENSAPVRRPHDSVLAWPQHKL